MVVRPKGLRSGLGSGPAAALALSLAGLGLAGCGSGAVSPASRSASARAGGAGPQLVGCTTGAAGPVEHGPRAPRAVALSFDDGPNRRRTPRVLAILNRLHARATFFEEGDHVRGEEALMRRILASGDEIGNHSFDHPHYPGYGQLRATQRRIRAATGFTPCLFRPPYGAYDERVLSAARRNHLETILWSVDSEDSHHPGAAVIRANAVDRAEPGSIILMHDGGYHPQTVAALPRVIRGLRARGFRFETITALLGGRFLYARR